MSVVRVIVVLLRAFLFSRASAKGRFRGRTKALDDENRQ